MWRQINLIGRDSLLKRELIPRLNNDKPFLLSGKRGTGRTAVLEWCYDHTKRQRCITNASKTVREILLDICKQWDLQVTDEDGNKKPKSKWKTAWMERAIYSTKGYKLFLDDFDRAPPALLRRLKPIREKHILIATTIPQIKREDAKKVAWGLKRIKIKPLEKPDALRVAGLMSESLGSPESARDLVNASQGCPGRIYASCIGEIEEETQRTEGEEIDLSPVFLLAIAGVMITRYLAIGLDSTSLYLVGGIGMGLGLVARFMLFKGMSN